MKEGSAQKPVLGTGAQDSTTPAVAAKNKDKAPSVRRRRTQVERSDQTRKKLLEAAIKVFRKRGYLGFTVVEAAKVAGVTRGAPLHQFRTTDAYLLEALEYLFQNTLVRTEETASYLLKNDDLLSALMADTRATYFNDDFITGLDVLLSASKQSKTKAKVQEFGDYLRRQAEDLWRDRLIAVGVPADVAENIVMMLHCLIRGGAIRSLLSPTKDERIENALQFALQLVRGYLDQAKTSTRKAPASRARTKTSPP